MGNDWTMFVWRDSWWCDATVMVLVAQMQQIHEYRRQAMPQADGTFDQGLAGSCHTWRNFSIPPEERSRLESESPGVIQ